MATKVYEDKRNEIWASFDHDALVWELFASEECNDYLGYVADTLGEAREIAKHIAEERALLY